MARAVRLGIGLPGGFLRWMRLTYLYDFGDSWEHTIRVEYVVAPQPGARYPQLVEAIGRCPPRKSEGRQTTRNT